MTEAVYDKWLTTVEFAALINLSYKNVLDLCKEGKLPCFEVGKGKKRVFRLPREKALKAFDEMLTAPVMTKAQTSAGDEGEESPGPRKQVKIYKVRKAKEVQGGFDFRESIKALYA